MLGFYTGWAGEISSDDTESRCKDNQVTHVRWWTLQRLRFSPKRNQRLLTCHLASSFCCRAEDPLLKTWEDTLGATAVTMKEGDSRDYGTAKEVRSIRLLGKFKNQANLLRGWTSGRIKSSADSLERQNSITGGGRHMGEKRIWGTLGDTLSLGALFTPKCRPQ